MKPISAFKVWHCQRLLLLLCLFPLAAQAQTHLLRQKKLKRWDITPANYSGIAPLGNQRYAVVSDKETADGFFEWLIEQDSVSGKVLSVQQVGFHANGGAARDAEGIAFCPQRNSLFVSAEDDQQIAEYSLSAERTGHVLQVPAAFRVDSIQANRGFEALTCDAASGKLFTTTENTLPADGPSTEKSPYGSAQLRLLTFSADGSLLGQQFYPLDAPRHLRKKAALVHGVVAMAALSDSVLLVLEREAGIVPRNLGSYVACKLYRWDVTRQQKTLQAKWTSRLKTLKHNWANYEGMCLGRTLSDGRQTLLLVSDSQGGVGNSLYHLKDYIRVIILDN